MVVAAVWLTAFVRAGAVPELQYAGIAGMHNEKANTSTVLYVYNSKQLHSMCSTVQMQRSCILQYLLFMPSQR